MICFLSFSPICAWGVVMVFSARIGGFYLNIVKALTLHERVQCSFHNGYAHWEK
jgi:hypothetical protein